MSKHIQPWVQGRILTFLNRARTIEDFTQSGAIQDNPDNGRGYAIGAKTAQKILNYRNQLPGRRFRDLEQVLDVPGVGEDKLNDLAHSLAISADDFFVARMFDGVLLENWELSPQRQTFADEAEFKAIVQHEGTFKQWVAEHWVGEFHPFGNELGRFRHLAIRRAFLECYPDGHLAALQLAFWFYLFDRDNWFSFRQVREACEEYLNYHSQPNRGMEFRFLKGLEDLEINPLSRSNILPVVVNYAEQAITIWEATLND